MKTKNLLFLLLLTLSFGQKRAMAMDQRNSPQEQESEWAKYDLISACILKAAPKGDVKYIDYAIRKGVNINRGLGPGTTILATAIGVNSNATERLLVVERLLQEETLKINAIINTDYKFAAIHIAICTKSLKIISMLLTRRELNVNVQTKAGETALCLAVKRNCSKPIILLLLERGANPHLLPEEVRNLMYIKLGISDFNDSLKLLGTNDLFNRRNFLLSEEGVFSKQVFRININDLNKSLHVPIYIYLLNSQ